MVEKRALGRGLGAVFAASTPAVQSGQAPSAVPGAVLLALAPSDIVPNARQPRQHFDEDGLRDLVNSIREVGVLQPVVVRDLGDGRYELVMGERRWRAAQVAGLDTIPAILRQTGDEAMLRDALLENLHRQELNPLEEAAAYQQLLLEFDVTHEELAARIGRSRPQISNTIRLLGLPPTVQRRVAAGVLSAGHARALLGLEDPTMQEQLAARIVAELLSVRAVEELVSVSARSAGSPRRQASRVEPPETAAVVSRAQQHLADRLETRVAVVMGKGKGKITIEFADLADLERITAVLAAGHTEDSVVAS